MSVESEYEDLTEEFRSKGFGARLGFGKKPALVAVDFSAMFTSDAHPLGADASKEIEANNAVVRAGRALDMPVIYSVPKLSANLRDGGIWIQKAPGGAAIAADQPGVYLDERCEFDDALDVVMHKHYPSVFFGTSLATVLITRGIDTVLVTGLTTSGCVRATAVDACCYGFRTIVVREGCGDRARLPHIATLFDLEMKYADVMSVDDAVAGLERLAGDREPAQA